MSEPESSAGRIAVGFIGLSAKGGWGSVAHLPALRGLPQFDVRAVSASTPQSSREAAERHGIPVACADHWELVARDDIDLVVITVKVPAHHELVSAAIAAGKDVFCEWPLGNGLAEAQDLTRMATERGIRTFVGLQARSAPPVRYIRDLVQRGAVGEVLSTTVVASGHRWGAVHDSGAAYLLDRRNGASMLTIPFGHTADGICFALGEFRSLSATTAVRRPTTQLSDVGRVVQKDVEDQIAVHGELVGGATVSMHYRGGVSAGTNFLWEINGTEGDIVVRGETGHLQYGLLSIEGTGLSGALEHRQVPARFCRTATDPNTRVHTVAEAFAQIGDDLIHGTDEAPNFAVGLRRHVMLGAIERSAATGARQFLD